MSFEKTNDSKFFESPECQMAEIMKNFKSPKFEDVRLMLLKNRMIAEFKNSLGENLLHILFRVATRKRGEILEVTKLLLDFKVDATTQNKQGFTPLHFAVKQKNYDLVSAMIENGADVKELTFEEKLSPLYIAALCGNDTEILDLLVKSGADVNAKTMHGRTPLHEACIQNYNDQIIFLIKKGANVCVEDAKGRSPFSLLSFSLENKCLITMLKEFSMLSFENNLVSQKDVELIHTSLNINQYFFNCKEEILKLSKNHFYNSFTYYDVLKMSKNIKKLAKLTKNFDFVDSFLKNYPLSSYFNEELCLIFNDANYFNEQNLIVKLKLSALFKNYLPDVVINKLVENLNIQDLPSE